MDDLSRQVAQNTQELNNGQRRPFNIRINGEEHSASSDQGEAVIYFPMDGQLMNVAECAFKLIINNGKTSGGGNPNIPCDNWNWGTETYKTYQEWLARYPIGSQIDVDCAYGCQCYDYASAFWRAQVNRNLLTGCPGDCPQDNPAYYCGQARGIWISECARATNAGSEFTLITDWKDLQPADWLIFGLYDNSYTGVGHVAMATAKPENLSGSSSIAVLQQNGIGDLNYGSPLNSGTLYREGGAYGDFLGAFRYNNQTWLDSLPKT